MTRFQRNWLLHIECEGSSQGIDCFYRSGYGSDDRNDNKDNPNTGSIRDTGSFISQGNGSNIGAQRGNGANKTGKSFEMGNGGIKDYSVMHIQNKNNRSQGSQDGTVGKKTVQNSSGHSKYLRKKRIRNRLFWLIAILLVLSLGSICGYFSYVYALSSSTSADEKVEVIDDPKVSFEFDIPMGSSTTDIADLLVEKDIIEYPLFFKLLSMYNGYDGTYQAGIHPLEKDMDYNTLNGYERLMKILSGPPRPNPTIDVTIPEGKMYAEIEDILAGKGLINRERFNRIAENEEFEYRFLANLPQRPHRLEGYLFPETYKLDAVISELNVIKTLLDQFDKIMVPEYYDRAEQLGMSVDKIIILASIIEREARVDEERPVISGVFHNRLKSKAPLNRLQSCATLQYIIYNRTGVVKEFLTYDDEAIDDPYNTYMYPGLPPGPICSPGLASIDAALYPEDTEYYYFAAKDDGTGGHYFSRTYDEHLAAVAQAERNRAAAKQ